MSGIESLVTQVHRGETAPRIENGQAPPVQHSPQQQQQQQTLAQSVPQQPDSQPSCWSRLFCCGSSKPKNADTQTQQQTRPLVNNNDLKSSSSQLPQTDATQPNTITNTHQPTALNVDAGNHTPRNEERAQLQSPKAQSRAVQANTTPMMGAEINSMQFQTPPPLNGHTNGYTQYVYNNYNPQTNSFDFGEGYQEYLLRPLPPLPKHKKTLVLDLDETLVHSSFKRIDDADFQIEIELDGVYHQVYVRKRPFVDEFLAHIAKDWEVVIFTASLAKYADPLLDTLDVNRVISKRLFRESCVHHYKTYYVKDLRRLGRPISDCTIIDNSAFSYMFQPEQGLPIISWYDDRTDTQLKDLLPFLDMLAHCRDIRHAMYVCQPLFVDGGIVVPYTIPDCIEMMRTEEYWTHEDDVELQKYYNNPDGVARPIAYGAEVHTGMIHIAGEENFDPYGTPLVQPGQSRTALNSPMAGSRTIGQRQYE